MEQTASYDTYLAYLDELYVLPKQTKQQLVSLRRRERIASLGGARGGTGSTGITRELEASYARGRTALAKLGVPTPERIRPADSVNISLEDALRNQQLAVATCEQLASMPRTTIAREATPNKTLLDKGAATAQDALARRKAQLLQRAEC